MMNCVSAGYVREYGIPQTLEDLARHRLVHYAHVLGSRSEGFEYLHNGKYRQVAMTGGITVNNAECYSAACTAGLGIVQVPLMGARAMLASGEWVAVLPDYVPAPMEVWLLYARQQPMPERLRVFMQWLEALFQVYASEA
jgi:DNA-binding transcriptional LysR family regulator